MQKYFGGIENNVYRKIQAVFFVKSDNFYWTPLGTVDVGQTSLIKCDNELRTF